MKTAPLSSFKIAYDVMDELAGWIAEKKFQFSGDVERLSQTREFKPMKVSTRMPLVSEVMTKRVHTACEGDTLKEVSTLMVEKGVDQIPIADGKGRLLGIVTSFDITRATSQGKHKLSEVMSGKVLTSKPTESIEETSRRLERNGYNSAPVVDANNKIVGIITVSDINRVWGRIGK